jgi:hypothetical protein
MKNIIMSISIVIVFSLLFFSCSENSTNPDVNILRDQIIGNWNDDNNYSITFLNDGTFIDTIYFENIKDTSYRNYGMFVRKGDYNINNTILSLTDFYFDEVNTQASIGYHMEPISYDLTYLNNNLTMKPVNIFESGSNNRQQLYGDWHLNGYYCVYSQEIDPKTSFGKTIKSYTFYSDSSKYSYKQKYLTGVYSSSELYSYQGEYIYNEPYLDLPISSAYHLLVKFNDDSMYWYYNSEITLFKN